VAALPAPMIARRAPGRWCWLAVVLAPALLGAAASAQPAKEPPIGPQSEAAVIRAARPSVRAAEHAVVFDRVSSGATVRATVGLGRDYVHETVGDRTRLIDFALRRVIEIDARSGTFTNLSLYAVVGFRAIELPNRLGMRKVLGSTLTAEQKQKLGNTLDLFWIETELGLRAKGESRPVIDQRNDGGVLTFGYGGDEWVRFVPSDQAVPPAFAGAYMRWLHHFAPLHPDIVEVIGKTGVLPRELTLHRIAFDKRVPETLRLVSARGTEADYRLPPTLKPQVIDRAATDPDGKLMASLVPVMLEAVAGRHRPGPPAQPALLTATQAAIRDGQGFRAALLFIEASHIFGPTALACPPNAPAGAACVQPAAFRDVVQKDARAGTLLGGFGAVGKEPRKAVDVWTSLKRDDVTNGYVIDISIANALSATLGSTQGENEVAAETRRRFQAAIRGNPYVASYYDDLGDHFARKFQTPLAWLCFDLARALPGPPQVRNEQRMVHHVERNLPIDYPQLF
jgi:hypothetical protein